MGELVEDPPTVDSIRALTLKAHGYAVQPLEADEDTEDTYVYVCSCGSDGNAPDREALGRLVDRHLDKVIRAAFAGTEFEGERGTTALRGYERRVHDSLR